MKLPNWFRILWWMLLLLLIGSILYARRDDLLAGRAVPADVLIFLVWVALLLVPLFQEVNLFGVKLKQEVKVKGLKDEVASLRAEFRNTVNVRAQINPTFNIPAPPPDRELPALEQRLRSVLNQVLTERGVQLAEAAKTGVEVSDDVIFLVHPAFLWVPEWCKDVASSTAVGGLAPCTISNCTVTCWGSSRRGRFGRLS